MTALVKATQLDRRTKSTDEQVLMALGPIFIAFPNSKATEETLNLYKMMLRDIEPTALVHAVLECIKVCKFFPTIAEIREHVAPGTLPGPSVPTPQAQMEKPIPQKFHRLSPEEDKRQRDARLKETRHWDKLYQ
jgi:hypothetical protein